MEQLSLQKKLNLSDLVIGVTIVAIGPSMPELVVSLVSALKGNTDIVLGNVIGSNVANILLILGVSAVIHPIQIERNSLLINFPISIVTTLLLLLLSNNFFYKYPLRITSL
jgi:cation:H+ antiporter